MKTLLEIIRLMPTGFINGFGIGMLLSPYQFLALIILNIGLVMVIINTMQKQKEDMK